MSPYFESQSKLLLDVLGLVVMQNDSFVLKGGTAINFFHANMPRLSVDIDLAYTKINSRGAFLKENEAFHLALSDTLTKKKGLLTQIKRTKEGIAKQITVASRESGIKVETNLVLRGTVFPSVLKESCETIRKKYATQLTVPTLSFEDIYAGKFCAALDRQHPRDLFDVMIFFQKHTFTEKLKTAFLVYLLSGNRPISEMIHPNRVDQRQAFSNEFAGMTDHEVAYEELEAAREKLIQTIDASLTQQDREFLMSFKRGKPLWEHLEIEHIRNMPAMKWKLHNIGQMEGKKHHSSLNTLAKKLDL